MKTHYVDETRRCCRVGVAQRCELGIRPCVHDRVQSDSLLHLVGLHGNFISLPECRFIGRIDLHITIYTFVLAYLILYYSTDFELVILVSLIHTYCVVMLVQPVSLVEFHLQ